MPEETKSYRKLTATSCEVLTTGTSKTSGNPWTMYEVFAVDEAGTPVEAKLRSFDELPLNELIEYGVTMRQDQRHGTSYTLELPKNRRPKKDTSKGYKAQIDALKLQVGSLERTVENLYAHVAALQAAAGLEPVSLPATSGHQSPATAAGAPDPGAGGAALGQGPIPT